MEQLYFTNDFLTKEDKEELLKIAKESVENFVKFGKKPDFKIKSKNLNIPLGAFVTLKKNGQLRGCIGKILSFKEPLWKVVSEMAIAAATEDPRFEPVSEKELKDLEFEISVIFNYKKINSIKEIEIGKHGVHVISGFYSGLFLPQVATEYNWTLEELLDNLMLKAGLPPKYWKDHKLDFYTFEAIVFS